MRINFFLTTIGILLLIAASFLVLPKESWPANIPGSDYFQSFFSSGSEVLLLDPEMSPLENRALVMKGFRILINTPKEVPQNVGDRLRCASCHFDGGNTLGGENGGISLVGVAETYPKKLANGQAFSLEARINDCFQNSMNGKALEIESDEMKALVAYMDWISSSVKGRSSFPWLGLKKLQASFLPDPENGQRNYMLHCAICHGKDGQGQPRKNDLAYPPLWGNHSFNTSAGMNQLSKLSSFIFYNMPYQEPSLKEKQAIDIAAYVLKQSRTEKK